MARLRYNGLTATLGAALAAGDTTITFAAALTHSVGAAVPTIAGSDYIPLTILDASGNVAEIVSLTAYTSGATTGTITRAQESTTALAHAAGVGLVHGLTVADATAFASSSGGLLASKSYNPSSFVVPTLTTTDADVDATNLAVTFTAPASGSVLVKISMVCIGNPGTNIIYTVRSGTTTLVRERVLSGTASTPQQQIRAMLTAKITGLTAGSSYTYKMGAYYQGTGTAGLLAYGDTGATDTIGPGVIEVWSA